MSLEYPYLKCLEAEVFDISFLSSVRFQIRNRIYKGLGIHFPYGIFFNVIRYLKDGTSG